MILTPIPKCPNQLFMTMLRNALTDNKNLYHDHWYRAPAKDWTIGPCCLAKKRHHIISIMLYICSDWFPAELKRPSILGTQKHTLIHVFQKWNWGWIRVSKFFCTASLNPDFSIILRTFFCASYWFFCVLVLYFSCLDFGYVSIAGNVSLHYGNIVDFDSCFRVLIHG